MPGGFHAAIRTSESLSARSSPPYLFREGGALAPRPVISDSPREIQYRSTFDITVAGPASSIGSVSLIRSDHNTHSLTAGDRYVKLAFHARGDGSTEELRMTAPKLPAQAVPGVYAL